MNQLWSYFLIGFVNSLILYPVDESQLQYLADGAWFQCNSSNEVNGQQISLDLNTMVDRYQITGSGLCSKNFKIATREAYLFVRMSTNNTEYYHIAISNSIIVNRSYFDNIQQFQIELLDLNSPIQIQITPTQEKVLYIFDLKITNSTLPDGCLQAGGYHCSECYSNYIRYYGACFDPSQVDNITNIAYNGFNSNQSIQDGQLEVEFDMSPNMLGSIGRIYIQIVDNFQDFSNPYFIPNSQLTFTNHQLIKAKIGIEDLQSSNCRQLYTSDSIFYQCYFNLLLTLQGQIQFQYLKLLTLQINRATRTQLTIGAQDIGSNQETQNLELLQVTQVSNITTEKNDSWSLQLNQTMVDPTYRDFMVKYIDSQMIYDKIIQDNTSFKFINLTRINQSTLIYNFIIFKSEAIKENATISFRIISQLEDQNSTRFLQETRLNLQYFLKPEIKIQLADSQDPREQHQQDVAIIVGIVAGVIFLLLVAICVWFILKRRPIKTFRSIEQGGAEPTAIDISQDQLEIKHTSSRKN